MMDSMHLVVVAALLLLVLLVCAPAVLALEGRTLASVVHTDGIQDSDALRFLYDLGGIQNIHQNLDLHLRLSLNYYSRLEQNERGLWTSRFQGQLRAQTWRVDGQFAPWQRNSLGLALSRERQSQLGIHLIPRRLPQLDADWNRLERETADGISTSEYRRAQVSYARNGVGGNVGFQRIDTTPGGIGAATRTDDWHGAVQAMHAWRRGSIQGVYDALHSQFEARERRRTLATQRVALDGGYTPVRRLTLGGSALRRWGSSSDNAVRGVNNIDEMALSANVEYKPVRPVELQATREYRRQRIVGGNLISDYLQLEAMFRQPMTRDFIFQTGYLGVLELGTGRGDVPNNSAYVIVDGRLRRGVDARGELRAAQPTGSEVSGVQWRRLLQLRTRPSEPTRFEVTWRRDTQAEFLGQAQTDREWQLLGGWDPFQGANFVISWRALDGMGRVLRSERELSWTGTWTVSQRSTLSANWSRRTSEVFRIPFESDVLGLDASFFLPSELQTRASYREASEGRTPETRSYALSVEKRF